jgi:hypothetical protein
VWSFLVALLLGAGIARSAPTDDQAPPRSGRWIVACGCLVIACFALGAPHPPNVWDFGSERQSAEETALAAWLRENAPPQAMLVTPPFPPTWLQPKTGHPVLFDMMTLLSMTYFPAEADPVARIVRDLYDVDYTRPADVDALRGPDGMLRPSSPVWLRAWPARSCEAWREIGARWRFGYVLSPHETALRLPAVWSGRAWTLYEVPAACAAKAT